MWTRRHLGSQLLSDVVQPPSETPSTLAVASGFNAHMMLLDPAQQLVAVSAGTVLLSRLFLECCTKF